MTTAIMPGIGGTVIDLKERLAAIDAAEAETPENAKAARVARLRAQLVTTHGLDDIPDPVPLVPGILFRDSLAWVYGEPGCGKSFVAIDLAACVATGETWQGYGPAAEATTVLYLVAEGVSGIKRRVRAWEESYGHLAENVHFLPVAVQTSNASEWGAFVELAAELGAGLVIIDTQARVTVGQEENSNTEMGIVVERMEQLRKATGGCVLIVHHTGRAGEHMRGAVALDGAATTTIKITKDEEIVSVECTKQKDAPEFDQFQLRLVGVGESAILSLTTGPGQADLRSTAVRKLLVMWWDTYETAPVSATSLIEVTKLSKATVHRYLTKLCKTGIATKGGSDARPTYSLPSKPEL